MLGDKLKVSTIECEKLKKDVAKIQIHVDRLEGKAVPPGTSSDEVWLFAEFDTETPLLFTDTAPVKAGDIVDGKLVSKDDICVIL